MSAEFMVRLKSLERRQLALEEDNKWLKDALTKVLAQDSVTAPRASRTVQSAKSEKAA